MDHVTLRCHVEVTVVVAMSVGTPQLVEDEHVKSN